MSSAVVLPMAAFALAASLSPGPVNLVALSTGLSYGFRHSLRHVSGATCGFTLLLLAIGGALQPVLNWPPAMIAIRWAGVLFLFYMSVGLALDDGHLRARDPRRASFRRGALMQWLNPKAWMASAAGTGAYTSAGSAGSVALFALIFFVICYLSLASWAALGAWLGRRLPTPRQVRWINRGLALMLLLSASSLAVVPLGDTGQASLR
ncbi:LysE family translocator [Salinicola lusitanus]|uniref:LysE family translocator n=1 Tax=Salinicola lusitanus TaxID=1949085 RepID=UPI000DA209DF|nr:LysE family translocator [Salinicola lusitanus]